MKTPKNRANPSKKQMCNKMQNILALCNTHVKVKGMNSDRLEILTAKCAEEIREVLDRLRVLRAKHANLIALAQESEKLADPESEPDKYANVGLTEAVLEAVKVLWDARKIGASTIEIKNHLLAHGFKAGENFDTAIYTVLGRLCESGQINVDEKPWKSGSVEIRGRKIRLPARKVYRPK
jgi:hypothetical protein